MYAPVRDPHAGPKLGRAIPVRPPGLARTVRPRTRHRARRPKLRSGDLEGATTPLLAAAQSYVPLVAAAYCRSRHAGSLAGLEPKRRCGLDPYPALWGATRPARAAPIVIHTADGTAGGLETSTYIATTHGLNSLHRRAPRGAAQASALPFAGGLPLGVLSHERACAATDLEAEPVARAAIRGGMIQASGGFGGQGAGHCLCAVGRIAEGSDDPEGHEGPEAGARPHLPLGRAPACRMGPRPAPAQGPAQRTAAGEGARHAAHKGERS